MWFLFSLYIVIIIVSVVLFYFQQSLYSVQYNYYKLIFKFPDLFGTEGNELELLGYSALTGIVYTDDSYLKLLLPDIKLNKFTIGKDHIGFIIDKGDYDIISLRGTSNLEDILVSMDTSFTHVPDGKIHQGYYNKVMEFIQDYPLLSLGTKKIICGHSMGGALVSILGYLLHKQNPKLKIYVYTFGSPMYGDIHLKEYISNQKSIKMINYINVADPVVYKPTDTRYKRIGTVKKWKVDSGNDNVNHNIRTYRACVLKLKETRCKRTHRFDEILSRFFLDLLG